MQERIGQIGHNAQGLLMTIVDYRSYSDIDVKFENGFIKKTSCQAFKKGNIYNPMHQSYLNIGFRGYGKYLIKKRDSRSEAWMHMLKRCYDRAYIERYPTYNGCQVAEEWHNFQNFGKWFDENFYHVSGQRTELDKDIMLKGNKIYGPDTCIFVPQRINALFLKATSARGDCPIGVTRRKSGRYLAQCNDGGGRVRNLGRYDCQREAFLAYKAFKEMIIKQTALEYRHDIPSKLFDALMNYEVEIDD